MAETQHKSPAGLGIIACGGNMPLVVAKAAQDVGRPVHIVAIEGAASKGVEAFPHSWVQLSKIGRLLKLLRENNCHQLVIVGAMKRPDYSRLRPDFGAIINLPTILKITVGGDNLILSVIVNFFDKKGFEVVGAQDIAKDLLVGVGPMGRHRPNKIDLKDIEIGLNVVEKLGALDVGQGAVVASQYVLAVEAAEGTDQMLDRCKDLRQSGARKKGKRSGVLVKCPKPNQERRIDLPTVGPQTVRGVVDAGLKGIALAANNVLVIDRDELIQLADEAGIFIFGVVAKDSSD